MTIKRLALAKVTYISIALFLGLSFLSFASADISGEQHTFFVNSYYDASGRNSISATLAHVGANAYFYIDDEYRNGLSVGEKIMLDQKVISLAQDFDNVIYPKETEFWGFEARPGVDDDPHITILLQRLTAGTGGYFETVNGYTSSQSARSNQREMIVVSVASLGDSHLRSFLAHEFQHLVSFNQKEIINNVSEDVWLNELRSQYAVSVAGYNGDFRSSDLFQRLRVFLDNPTDSLTEWPNINVDYSSVTLFGHYLFGRFGSGILSETLSSPLTGIESINAYLASHLETERFPDIFADWLWATYYNNQVQDSRYGYADENLKYIRVSPTEMRQLNSASLNTFSYSLKPWQPTWYQFSLDPHASSSMNIKFSWPESGFQISYGDGSGIMRTVNSGDVFRAQSAGGFVLMPVNISKISNFGTSELVSPLNITIEYTNEPVSEMALLKDGALISHRGTPDIYVVWGQYKRYLAPEVLKFYGLENTKVITVPESIFQSYMPSNYVRAIDEKKVYAVWPDGTKHWLNMSAQTFSDTHRDWNSVFIINDLESNYYKVGSEIKN